MNDSKINVRLKDVNLTLSTKCNINCKMCGYVEYASHYKELSTDKIKETILDCKDLGLEILTLSGGEPMMRKDIFEIISFATALGLKVSMVSNGTLIDREKAKKIVESGLNAIIISLEGFEDKNDYIRGEGNYKKALNAISCFMPYKKELGCIKVGVVVSKLNYTELFDFTKYLFEEIGINAISYNPLDKAMMGSKADAYLPKMEVTPDIIPALSGEIEKIITFSKTADGDFPPEAFLRRIPYYFEHGKIAPKFPCKMPTEGCGISGDGSVYPCWSEDVSAGNIVTQSIKDIVISDEYQRQCAIALHCACKGCLSACYMNMYAEKEVASKPA